MRPNVPAAPRPASGHAPSGPAPLEKEVKVRVADLATARAMLERAGARADGPGALEDDCLLDDAPRSLSARDHVLRVREQVPFDSGPPRVLLTWKGPTQVRGGLRVREEIETEIADGAAFRMALDRLGYRPCFRYQKRRWPYALAGAFVALDETPLGIFLEIEGEDGAVAQAAARLGVTPDSFLTASYAALWRDSAHAGDMLLDPNGTTAGPGE